MARMRKTPLPHGSSSTSSGRRIDWGTPPDLAGMPASHVRVGSEFHPTERLMWEAYLSDCRSRDLPPVGKVFWPFRDEQRVSVVLPLGDHPRLKSAVLLKSFAEGWERPVFCYSYDLLDAFLGNLDVAGPTYYHRVTRLVMVVGEGEARNKYLPELIAACLGARQARRLKTILLSKNPLATVARKWDNWRLGSEESMTEVVSGIRRVGG